LPQSLLFPPDNWWNLDISNWPVDPNSSSYIAFINNGGTRRLHPDFGGNAATTQDPNAIYGFPYAVVSNVIAADLRAVQFAYAGESDGVNHPGNTSFPFYPIPPEAITQPYWIEGGDPGNVDRGQPRPSFADCGSGPQPHTSFSTSATMAYEMVRRLRCFFI
jgi:hypothetical protein